ncbi:MAG TPA: sterol desaturase family protein [Planctomycetota bacterium]|nr:sterol desaturase family protein [Planctomycetota bacterium]
MDEVLASQLVQAEGGAAIPGWVTPALVVGAFALLTWLETRRQLRVATRDKLRRVLRNLGTGALAAAVVAPLQSVALAPLAARLEGGRIGLLYPLGLPPWLHVLAAVLLLDWSLWVWHWLNHVVPFLWRFHLVHHVDQDLDASTALRFHFGELALSIPYRALQIAAIGVPASALGLWSAALFVSILFHHSNLRLPLAVERWLVRLVVTPRMHGIHHSTVRSERDTNYSSLLSVWDRLHGTTLLAVPQREVRIGVPPLLEAEQVTFGRITLLPFGRAARAGLAEAAGPPRAIAPRSTLVP